MFRSLRQLESPSGEARKASAPRLGILPAGPCSIRPLLRVLPLLLILAGSPARAAGLEDSLREVLTAPAWGGARVGLLVVRVRDGEVLASWNPDDRLVPASALKALTAAAALEALGSDFRFATRVRADGPLEEGVLRGDLVLQGGGDPELNQDQLDRLAEEAAQRVRRVEGRLRVDPSALAGPPFGPGWAWEDVPLAFSAEISGLTMDRGAVEVLVSPGQVGQAPRVEGKDLASLALENLAVTGEAGSASTWEVERLPGRAGTRLLGSIPVDEEPASLRLAVASPALWVGRRFAEALRRRGVEVGDPVEGSAAGEEVARVESRPLVPILSDALAASDNLVFEALYRTLPDPGGSLPLEAGSYRMVDGSGLSRYNLVSPRQVVQVLRSRPALAFLLPRAGLQGTLRGRLEGVALRAKTGTMGGVSALVGFLEPDRPEDTLVFALVSNGFVGPAREVKALEDRVVRILDRERRGPDAGARKVPLHPSPAALPRSTPP